MFSVYYLSTDFEVLFLVIYLPNLNPFIPILSFSFACHRILFIVLKSQTSSLIHRICLLAQ